MNYSKLAAGAKFPYDDSIMEKRKEFLRECKEKLSEWRSVLEDLRSDFERGDPGSDDDQGRELHELSSHFEDIEEQLRNLEQADDEEWQELRELLEQELESFQESLEEVREEVEDV